MGKTYTKKQRRKKDPYNANNKTVPLHISWVKKKQPPKKLQVSALYTREKVQVIGSVLSSLAIHLTQTHHGSSGCLAASIHALQSCHFCGVLRQIGKSPLPLKRSTV